MGQAVINAIENVLLVALGMKHGELRRIEESARIQAVHFDKIPQFFPAIGQVNPPVAEPNDPYDAVTLPVGLVTFRPERVSSPR